MLLLAAAVAAAPARAADPVLSEREERTGARMVEVATPFTQGRGNLETTFGFRIAQSVQDGDEHNLWGIDSAADVVFALAYGVTSRFDLELLRSSFDETYELAAKWQLLDASRGAPFSLAVRLGGDWIGAQGVDGRQRPFAQLLLARRLGRGVLLTAAPSYVDETPRLRHAGNVPLGLTLPFVRGSLLKLEVVPENRDLDDSKLGWRLGVSKASADNIFEMTIGNSRATTVDQILGGDFAGGFETGDVRLGFNVVRYWRLSK